MGHVAGFGDAIKTLWHPERFPQGLPDRFCFTNRIDRRDTLSFADPFVRRESR
jgi:hypothetical protein